jgi:hypothetical protein
MQVAIEADVNDPVDIIDLRAGSNPRGEKTFGNKESRKGSLLVGKVVGHEGRSLRNICGLE